jgi:hypothetical protein
VSSQAATSPTSKVPLTRRRPGHQVPEALANLKCTRFIHVIVHTVRRLNTHHFDAAVFPDWALLQVDFSNAFNLVRRDVFCQSNLEHFPALGPWVTWCYDSPSHLFYERETVCSSARGAQ